MVMPSIFLPYNSAITGAGDDDDCRGAQALSSAADTDVSLLMECVDNLLICPNLKAGSDGLHNHEEEENAKNEFYLHGSVTERRRIEAIKPFKKAFECCRNGLAAAFSLLSTLRGILGSCKDMRRRAQPWGNTRRTPSYDGLATVMPACTARFQRPVRPMHHTHRHLCR